MRRYRSTTRRRALCIAVALTVVSSTATAQASTPKTIQVADAASRCARLADFEVRPWRIGHPTRGATIDSTTLTAADAALGRPEFCLVKGRVLSHDPTAAPINFQLNLPTSWNVKTVQFGGAGLNGFLINGLGSLANLFLGSGPATGAPPINRGYATFGDDGGVAVGSNPPGSFALNAEELANYGGESVKRSRDTAIAIVTRYYRRPPAKQYFGGQSKGGHEALVAAQRYGKDYDGIVAYYPANQNQLMVLTWYHLLRVAYTRPGAYPNRAKQQLLINAVYNTCDPLDGAADGIISNLRRCNSTFDVRSLRCPAGADTGDTCLSDAQIETFDAAAEPYFLAFALANGMRTIGGYPVYEGADPLGTWLDVAGTGATTSYNFLAQPVIKYFIKQEPGLPGTGYDFDYRQYADRVKALSELLDATDTNLNAFAWRGGKLILVQGTTDMLVPPNQTTQYYKRLWARYGVLTRLFARYYVIPGYGHGNGRFNASWDPLAALEAWAERGVSPRRPVASDANPGAQRTRPLCEYPTYPKYVGGDVNQASSFGCAVR